MSPQIYFIGNIEIFDSKILIGYSFILKKHFYKKIKRFFILEGSKLICFENEKSSIISKPLFNIIVEGKEIKRVTDGKKENRIDVEDEKGEVVLMLYSSSESSCKDWFSQLVLNSKGGTFPGISLKSTISDPKNAFPGIQFKIVTDDQVVLKQQSFPGINTKIITETEDDKTWSLLLIPINGWVIEKSSTPIQIAFLNSQVDSPLLPCNSSGKFFLKKFNSFSLALPFHHSINLFISFTLSSFYQFFFIFFTLSFHQLFSFSLLFSHQKFTHFNPSNHFYPF